MHTEHFEDMIKRSERRANLTALGMIAIVAIILAAKIYSLNKRVEALEPDPVNVGALSTWKVLP